MRRRNIAALAAALGLAGAALLFGCGDDDPVAPAGPPATYQDLTEPWHPLSNLDRAFLQRDIDHYKACLDSAYYTFYFSDSDVSSGKTAEYWHYTEDTQAAERMFDAQLPDLAIRAVALEFDLVFNKHTIVWNQINPGTPDENWYTATFGYTFYIKLGDGREYAHSPGASAQVTVRQDPDDHLWRIVQIWDVPSLVHAAVERQEWTTFGQIKSIYTANEAMRSPP